MKKLFFILAHLLSISVVAATLGEHYIVGKIKNFDQTSVTIVTSDNQTIVVSKNDLPPKTKMQSGTEVKIHIKDKK